MELDNINSLIEKRQKWVQSCKENNFDFDSILAGVYSDPSHFIYEILQNAEDAGAKTITFNLLNDRLEVFHNGKDFDFKDVDGITGIGISTKKDDVNKIGKFGVGFKSVFAITKTPEIYSGKYNFKIEDFVTPKPANNQVSKKTQIILPFNHPSRLKEDVYNIVGKKLESIGLKTLLFLNNIEEIKWQTLRKTGHYYKETVELKEYKNVKRVSTISKIGDDEQFEEYLVIHRPIQIEGYTLKVEVGYKIEKNDSQKYTIVKEKESKLIAFFPTERVTYLNFLIQGPYKTTPNRENIPLEDEQNKYIIEETANLVSESITTIKEIGLMSVSFLETLPINKDFLDDKIYSCIYEKVKQILLSDEAYLPTSKGNFISASSAVLARGRELTEFLDNNDIEILFGKKLWLNVNITPDRTRELRDYLINELKVKEVDFKNFADSLTIDFIQNKSDAWLIDLYGRLLDQRSLWEKKDYYVNQDASILRKKPLIRLTDDSHAEPCDANDKIQVYLPSDTKSKYKTVKNTLTENGNSLKFLTELGLTKPDIFSEIQEHIIPKYKNTIIKIDLDEYYNDFEKILIASQKDDSTKKRELLNALKGLNILIATNSFSGKIQFKTPDRVYIKSDDLFEYFKGYNSVFFLHDEPYQKFATHNEALTNLLHSLGCSEKPRRIEIKPTLTPEDKYILRENSGCSYELETKDYDYEGLDNFLKNTTKERSLLLWDLLIESLTPEDSFYNKKDFFKGKYRWFYYHSNTREFESKFLKTLKKNAWLFDKNNNFVNPNQITISDLSDNYSINNENADVLISVLGFQFDEIRKIEEKTGGKFVSKEEYGEFQKWQTEQAKLKEKDEWTPEVEPENVKLEVVIAEPAFVITPDYRDQEPNGTKIEESTKDNKTEDVVNRNNEKSTNLEDIGRWGEQLVFRHLKDKFKDNNRTEIKWLNQDGGIGKGYDFSIVLNGIEKEYIEVKSKIGDVKQLFEITGTQWEFARKLNDEGEGDKYKIYVVSNAGSKDAKINIIENPIQLWKDGKLYAHPVNFKL